MGCAPSACRARTLPPWPLAWGSLAALLALAAVKPALSQGPADLAALPAALDLDLYYLALYPAIYAVDGMTLWWIVGAGGLLLLAAPWLPPRRTLATAARLTVHPAGTCATVRAGMALPYACRHGGCGVCRAQLTAGAVDYGAYQPHALPDAQRAGGALLLCCATALSDVEVMCAGAPAAVQAYAAYVAALERLAADVMLVRLKLDGGKRLTYAAGQFVNIVLPDGARRAYSLAHAGGTADVVELHVRHIPGRRYSAHVFATMRVGEAARFEGPFGTVALQDGARPLGLVAGATGFAPVKSILEHAFVPAATSEAS